ncbi:alpha-ketoglutarate dehydrogenase component 4-like [Hydractinia symbiolongicarpus]|uniref:alpha-ketoglutarate dehydrogenase component 4-like n=1 Tax=Hydractinia symbiolongicarpus TaxID=13093 RepID=UPI00254B1864|nr:alpha-ketoglutarate dehydrogenase component 4-like [Hydractinia symbiolongicarpus]XP_057302927.1 alpha-ketoglutarate dehydrogenase component 4-like [Hydractinia symbiolongicarpus]
MANVTVLFGCKPHSITTSLTAALYRGISIGNKFINRTPLISFPQRPSLTDRYAALERLKAASIPTSSPSSSSSPQLLHDVLEDTSYTKTDCSTVFITDVLPPRYRKPVISEEEIEYIMRGGPDR